MKDLIIAAIGFYRHWVSPALPKSCRFHPSCSAYAMEAVERHGAMRGSMMAAARILKCHPWHPGGFDPVSPQAEPKCKGLDSPIKLRSPRLSRGTRGRDILKNLSAKSASVNIPAAPRTPRPAQSDQ